MLCYSLRTCMSRKWMWFWPLISFKNSSGNRDKKTYVLRSTWQTSRIGFVWYMISLHSHEMRLHWFFLLSIARLCSLHNGRFMSQARRTRHFARSGKRVWSARRGEEKKWGVRLAWFIKRLLCRLRLYGSVNLTRRLPAEVSWKRN